MLKNSKSPSHNPKPSHIYIYLFNINYLSLNIFYNLISSTIISSTISSAPIFAHLTLKAFILSIYLIWFKSNSMSFLFIKQATNLLSHVWLPYSSTGISIKFYIHIKSTIKLSFVHIYELLYPISLYSYIQTNTLFLYFLYNFFETHYIYILLMYTY